MKVIIDRFEWEYAIVELEDKSMIGMPRKLLPQDVSEGDVINIEINASETQKRRKEIMKLMNELWE